MNATAAGTPRARPAHPKPRARRLASKDVIIDAATALFLRNGYLGTSMDEIAAGARVSKQTVYTHFADKEQLFIELIQGNFKLVDEFVRAVADLLQDTPDVQRDLRVLARRYVRSVIQPPVLQLRRLIIGEAGRFPELARRYYEQVPQRVIVALASSLQHLAGRGLLQVDDPLLAANHFAWLVLAVPLDQAMFCGSDGSLTPAALERLADAGVDVFVAAYARP
ncbi:MAG TPA: TetR/AcrR family transcriptional regulator [Chloroflexota bacterium]|nr:TetR/AcrR family transcriptional regulator [Chloroflexota bacterium]